MRIYDNSQSFKHSRIPAPPGRPYSPIIASISLSSPPFSRLLLPHLLPSLARSYDLFTFFVLKPPFELHIWFPPPPSSLYSLFAYW
ncbi:hypothetical protein GQ43DRAFT_178542 [Delitschia confertaspora ATCC 74209]|uniref:Uncharacterized protein n=1 Tax=Delitschia confertaspora ATCC 74209 TaxID=1513339 RepID=A0A9P4JSJ5_9PLEO|nr:hypothetical protein GQ43DRAFT_178542 [Delitschia confertaspora ATCC 74209]